MSKLFILTLNWNGKEKLEKLYPSLVNCLDMDYQWLIKDNDSKDDSLEFIKSWNNDKISAIKYAHNRDSFANGCNFLFREASPKPDDFILLLNNDVIFNDKDSLNKMINLMKKDNDIGAVGAKLFYTNTNKIQHGGVVFNKEYGLPVHFRVNESDDKHSSKNREFQAITGAVLLTKAKYYENACTNNKSGLHGMDESFIWCFDDINLCLSIKYNMNKKIVYCGETNIFHEESASLKKNPVNKLYLNQNVINLRNKCGKVIKSDKDLYLKDPNYNLYKGL